MEEEVSYNSNTAIPMLICGLRCTGAPRYFQHKWCNMHCHENIWVHLHVCWGGHAHVSRLSIIRRFSTLLPPLWGGEDRNSCCTLLHLQTHTM